jgi:hypothetical protein
MRTIFGTCKAAMDARASPTSAYCTVTRRIARTVVVWTICLWAGVSARWVRAQSPAGSASRVLAAARARIGVDSVVANVQTIDADAACSGPNSRYRTRVRSARDGRVVFEQVFDKGAPYRVVLGADRGWEWSGDSGRATPASALTQVEAHGHEIHMLTLAPGSRLGTPTRVVDTTFRGGSAVGVSFRDALGGRVVAYFSRRDSLPLGFWLPNHRDRRPSIMLVLARWGTVGALRLPMEAVFWQGRDAYRFHFTRVSLNAVPDSVSAVRPDSGRPRR